MHRMTWTLLMCAALAAGLTTPVTAQDVAILDLEDVRPGMAGKGLTVFQGTEPESFSFKVIGPIDHWVDVPRVLLVKLYGGPTDPDTFETILSKTHIISGMSGSPMFVDGKLIGALAFAPEFQTTSKAFLTPIKNMLAMRSVVDPTLITAAPDLQSGDHFRFCAMWGDAGVCSGGTVTLRDDGVVYALGHSLHDYGEGAQELPVWKSGVLDVLELQRSSVMLTSGAEGDIIGSIVHNGRFGSVITAHKPHWYTTDITIDRADGTPPVRRVFHAAYHKRTPKDLEQQIDNVVSLTIDNADLWSTTLEAEVTLATEQEPLVIVDQTGRGTAALSSLLTAVIQQQYPANPDPITAITVKISVDRERAMHAISHLELFRRDGSSDLQYAVLGTRKSDDKRVRSLQLAESLAAVVHPGETLAWLDGFQLHQHILQENDVATAITLLRQIGDRRKLNLVSVHNIEETFVGEPGEHPSQWNAMVQPTVSIRYQLTLPTFVMLSSDRVFTMSFRAIEGEPESVRVNIKRATLAEVLK